MFRTNIITSLILKNFSARPVQRFKSYDRQGRQSNILKKMMSGKRKPDWKWSDKQRPSLKPTSIFNTTNISGKTVSRRVSILNKLFMRHVTELIAANPNAMKLAGSGLEITRVRVCQNYHGLHVYWTASVLDDMDLIEQELAQMSGKLRHDLTQLQLMGQVPHVTFLRDKQFSSLSELDAVLAKADFGDDYVRNPYGQLRKKNDFEPDSLSPNELNKNESSLPPMRQDVMGLDHALIMGRIKQSLAKTRNAWKAYESNQMKTDNTATGGFTNQISFESIRIQTEQEKKSTEILHDFLQKRKLNRKLKKEKEFDATDMYDESQSGSDYEDELDPNVDWNEEKELKQYYDQYFEK